MWPLYDEAPGYDDVSGGAGFGLLVLIVLLICWIDDEIKKSKETSQKSGKKKEVENEDVKCGLKIEPTSSCKEKDKEASPVQTVVSVKRPERTQYTYIEEKICVDGYKNFYKTEKDRERIEREIKKLDDALEWIEDLKRKRANEEKNRRH